MFAPLLSLVLVAAPPPAAPELSPARKLVLSAAQLYLALEHEHALEQLARARTAEGRTAADDLSIALYEGIVLAELDRLPESDSAFRVALALDPDAKLPVKVSPKVQGRFDELAQKAKKSREALAQTVKPPPAAAPPAKDASAQPGAKVLIGHIRWSAVSGTTVFNEGDFSVKGCEVRIPQRKFFRWKSRVVIKAHDNEDVDEWLEDPRPPDENMVKGWALVMCEDASGYMWWGDHQP